MARLAATIVCALLIGWGHAPAQEEHRVRHDAGRVHEALAEAWGLLHREQLSPEEGDALLAALRRALDLGADVLCPRLGDAGAPFAPRSDHEVRFAARRVAARLVASLPEPLWDRWRAVHGAAAAALERDGSHAARRALLVLHPGTEEQGRALVAAADAALEAGFFGTAARHLLSYVEAFGVHAHDAPVSWSRVGLLLGIAGTQAGDRALVDRSLAILERWPGTVSIDGQDVEAAAALRQVLSNPAARPWHHDCLGGGPSRCSVAPSIALPLKAAWHRDDLGHDPAGPRPEVLADERALFLCAGASARALDIAGGDPLWSRDRPRDPARGVPGDTTSRRVSGALGAGAWILVLPGEPGGEGGALVVALDREDGAERWRRGGSEDPDPVMRSFSFAPGPVVADGLVAIAGTATGPAGGLHVLGFEATTGRLRWRTRVLTEDLASLPPRRAPAMAISAHRGIVFLSAPLHGLVAALDLESGAPRWIANERKPLEIFVGRSSGSLLAPRLEGGRLFLCPGPAGGVAAIDWDADPEPAKAGDPRPHLSWRLLLSGAEPPAILAATSTTLLLAGRDPSGRYPLARAFDRQGVALATPLPLDSPVAGLAAVTKCGVFVATGKYVFLVDPVSGNPGAPVISAESAGAAILGDLIPVRGGLISVTATRLSAWRSAR